MREVVEAVKGASETAILEARTGRVVVQSLEVIRHDMAGLSAGSQDILTAAIEAESAASEGLRGATQVATAAEEQAAAASEAQSAIEEQTLSLEQGQTLAGALALLAEQLRTGQADDAASARVEEMAEELSATIQEMSGAASEIMAAVEQINRGSQQQAAATHETSAAMAQIEKSAALAKTNAAGANQKAREAGGSLKTSREAVEGLMGGVDVALAGTRARLKMILSLEALGHRIDRIVETITLVAVQTSMLAVSGAVEAARAGDSGRGFSVVSSDIRKLAREASESADKVRDTVRGILQQIASVRRDLEQVVDAAEGEVERNQSLTGVLETIEVEVAALGVGAEAIEQRADAIMLAVAQASAGARQIAAAAEEASVASKQAAAAASEQARGAEDLAAAIEEIASLAGELKTANG